MHAISEALWKKKRSHPQQYSLEPQIAFHGTRMSVLPSIGVAVCVRVCGVLFMHNVVCVHVCNVGHDSLNLIMC